MSTEQSPEVDQINTILTEAGKAHECGDLQRAQKLYEKLLGYGDHPLIRYNLGLIYFDLKEFSDAAHSFRAGLAMVPKEKDMLFNLALSLACNGEIKDSISTYLRVLELDPDHIDANYNLANTYRTDQQFDKAITHYRKVIDCDNSHGGSINNIAYCFQRIDDPVNALNYYKRLLELRPDDPGALHMVSALTGKTIDKPHENYVREVFDNFSSHYDNKLINNLKYRVPSQLLELIDGLDNERVAFTSGLDLGCGTGLSGEYFLGFVLSLDGVDLSGKMVELAVEKNIYQNLYVDDLESYLEKCKKNYDFFIAADVFTYIGNLKSIFSLTRSRCKKDSIFCFSTEHTTDDEFSIRKTGRYAHNPDHIKGLAASNHWKVLHCKMANIRMEKDAWIRGNLWVLQAVDQFS